MKKSLTLLALLGSPVLWAMGPADAGHKTIRLSMAEAQVARSDMYQDAELPWYQLDEVTDFVLTFAEKGEFTTTVNYGTNITDKVRVSYSPSTEQSQAYVKVESNDLQVLIIMTYTGDTAGTATIAWHQAGDTRHVRNVTFTVQETTATAAHVELPEEIISTSPENMLDDGLSAILSRLENATYRSATDKLYRKRLVSLLPAIMVLQDPSWTSPDYKGNTALHYACGLSDVELVRWLVMHGADLEMSTEKGASIDACIGGKNAAGIKAILKEARAWRDRPYNGPAVDEAAAREAAAWLEVEFSGYNMENPEYDITLDAKKAVESAQLVYRYTKANQSMFSLGVDRTETLGGHLVRVLNARVSEEMFVEWILRDLKQSRLRMQVVRRGVGFTLARLPHMILHREAEGMPHDGATAVYRAACEGNAELVHWLISNGADRRLLDAQGKPTQLPANIPNLAEVQEALEMHD